MESILDNSIVQLIIALVLMVIGLKMTNRVSNIFLFLAWVLGIYVFYSMSFLEEWHLVPHLLIAVVFGLLIGLPLYWISWWQPNANSTSFSENAVSQDVESIPIRVATEERLNPCFITVTGHSFIEKDWDHNLMTITIQSTKDLVGCHAKLLSLRDKLNTEHADDIRSLMTLEQWDGKHGDHKKHHETFDLIAGMPQKIVVGDVDNEAQPTLIMIQYALPNPRNRGIIVGDTDKFWIDVGFFAPGTEPLMQTFLYGFDGHACVFWPLDNLVPKKETAELHDATFYAVLEKYRGPIDWTG